MPVLIVLRLEEGIAKRDCLDAFHVDVRDELGIDVEEHRHIHCLACIQPLLFEAKALDLAEVWSDLSWCHRVRCNADDIFI